MDGRPPVQAGDRTRPIGQPIRFISSVVGAEVYGREVRVFTRRGHQRNPESHRVAGAEEGEHELVTDLLLDCLRRGAREAGLMPARPSPL